MRTIRKWSGVVKGWNSIVKSTQFWMHLYNYRISLKRYIWLWAMRKTIFKILNKNRNGLIYQQYVSRHALRIPLLLISWIMNHSTLRVKKCIIKRMTCKWLLLILWIAKLACFLACFVTCCNYISKTNLRISTCLLSDKRCIFRVGWVYRCSLCLTMSLEEQRVSSIKTTKSYSLAYQSATKIFKQHRVR